MQKIENFEEVKATTGEFERPQPGGYVCKIVNVEDVPLDQSTGKGDYLRIEYDIAEGDLTGYYKKQFDNWGGTWSGNFIRSYKEKALGMFKHFTTCVEKSNNGYEWDWNETGLIGKKIGIVLGEEEYTNRNGENKVKLAVKLIKTVDEIHDGKFKIPELKRQETTQQAEKPNIDTAVDDDLPF